MDGQASAPHGQKRRAEDDLRNDQRLAKRFDLLNLGHNGKLYHPVQHAAPKPPPRTDSSDELMHLDDTKDKIYIHNLDDELSELESEEERLVFLPDIEKKLGKIPHSILTSENHPGTGSEMVLYGIPMSLSVPEGQDKVRKAIIESRARAREKQAQDAEGDQSHGARSKGTPNGVRNSHVPENEIAHIEGDEDAMDLG